MIFALATLHILFIWIPKFSLLSMVTQISFTNFDDSILLLFITTDWLIVFLFRIMNWNYPGLAILWFFLSQFHAIFRSAGRFFKTPFTDLAVYGIVVSKIANVSFLSTNLVGSHQRCSVKNSVLRNFTKFTGKHLCQRLFFNKVVCLAWDSGTGVFLWILRNF